MRIQRLSCVAILAAVVAVTMSMPFGSSARAAMCDEVWMPVCGTVNGMQRTFSNACWAKMAKAKHVHKGACKWK
jgi:hypothetical protein